MLDRESVFDLTRLVFGIDGTLTRTDSLDEEFFSRTFNEVYGWHLDTDLEP